jgi:hypothetical protein
MSSMTVHVPGSPVGFRVEEFDDTRFGRELESPRASYLTQTFNRTSVFFRKNGPALLLLTGAFAAGYASGSGLVGRVASASVALAGAAGSKGISLVSKAAAISAGFVVSVYGKVADAAKTLAGRIASIDFSGIARSIYEVAAKAFDFIAETANVVFEALVSLKDRIVSVDYVGGVNAVYQGVIDALSRVLDIK